ncbi:MULTISPECIES: TIGR02301 family protein [Chelativorans]|jgi:uncharacterized protein (TIGR02301 family)|uniref:TIGR02301 family protein n=1 Tax=Chelativorans sp. (strain BNC1) TaxID=266779 RepID=Q11JR6_CHESB|nr:MULTISPECIES: TIGR02301 family protein [Chelativorans]
MKTILKLLSAAVLASTFSLSQAAAQVPYDPQLMRLAEILGSVHFLRGLCGEEEPVWRERMESLLQAEAPSEERRAKLTASFNRGYRAFAGVYTNCTDAAVQAIDRYMKEGETLTDEITRRYGN